MTTEDVLLIRACSVLFTGDGTFWPAAFDDVRALLQRRVGPADRLVPDRKRFGVPGHGIGDVPAKSPAAVDVYPVSGIVTAGNEFGVVCASYAVALGHDSPVFADGDDHVRPGRLELLRDDVSDLLDRGLCVVRFGVHLGRRHGMSHRAS